MSAPRVAVLASMFAASFVLAAQPAAAEKPSLFDLARVSWDECSEAPACGDSVADECGAAVAAPHFGGCCWDRTKLTGDWGGCRTELAASGLTLDADNTSYYFGNTSGGVNRVFDYGGHADYVLNVDMDKLGLAERQFWKIRAEHRWGDNLANDTGAFIPPTVLANLPVADSEDLYLTNVLMTQFLSESFAVFAGKLDTLDGDTTAFASGRGKTQFSNLGLIANPVPLRQIPYSTLGAGFVVLHELQPIFTFTVLNAKDTARTSGFDELFEDGAALTGFLRLPTEFFGKLGHQGFGFAWTSRNVVSLGQDPRFVLPDVPIARQSDSWSLFWNCDQYLMQDPANPLRGWGYFARAAVADDQTDPLEWFLSAGIGGTSPLASRPADTFGIGWYTAGTSDRIGPVLESVLGPIGDGHGVEVFYNAAITPWCHVTPDLQVIVPAREEVDAALVVGVRANVDF